MAVLFRLHRGSLADSMQTVQTVDDFDQLVDVIRASRAGWPDQSAVTRDNVSVTPYGYDNRIHWNTHFVCVNGDAVGYTNGPLSNIA